MRHLEKWRGLRGRPRVVADHVLDIACAQARGMDEISGFGPAPLALPASVRLRDDRAARLRVLWRCQPELNEPKPGPAGAAIADGRRETGAAGLQSQSWKRSNPSCVDSACSVRAAWATRQVVLPARQPARDARVQAAESVGSAGVCRAAAGASDRADSTGKPARAQSVRGGADHGRAVRELPVRFSRRACAAPQKGLVPGLLSRRSAQGRGEFGVPWRWRGEQLCLALPRLPSLSAYPLACPSSPVSPMC